MVTLRDGCDGCVRPHCQVSRSYRTKSPQAKNLRGSFHNAQYLPVKFAFVADKILFIDANPVSLAQNGYKAES